MRRLTGHALVFAICCALIRGAVLVAPSHSVGPIRAATDEPASLRFACIELRGAVKPGAVEVEVTVEDAWGGFGLDSTWQDDWSAFGAADHFVRLVGERRAFVALARLGAQHSFQMPSGEGPARCASGTVDPREGEGRRKATVTRGHLERPTNVVAVTSARAGSRPPARTPAPTGRG